MVFSVCFKIYLCSDLVYIVYKYYGYKQNVTVFVCMCLYAYIYFPIETAGHGKAMPNTPCTRFWPKFMILDPFAAVYDMFAFDAGVSSVTILLTTCGGTTVSTAPESMASVRGSHLPDPM